MTKVRLLCLSDPLSAEHARSLLLDAGLHPFPLEQSANISIAGAELTYCVFLPGEEVERGQALLEPSGYGKFLY